MKARMHEYQLPSIQVTSGCSTKKETYRRRREAVVLIITGGADPRGKEFTTGGASGVHAFSWQEQQGIRQ
jgi:hypothetical protein